MPDRPLKCDAVFEGGGVKGIGLVGAVAVTEAQGYEFVNAAGTSAGAIIAALVAAGRQAAEAFFATWSFDRYKQAFRQGAEKNRRDVLLSTSRPSGPATPA